MSGIIENAASFIAGLDNYEERFHQMFRKKVRMLVHEGMRRLIAKTPVNTGEAVMNYVASGGTPRSSSKEAGPAVEATNKLALGAERLRPRAAAVATATVGSVDFSDPYNVFWITNSTPHIQGLEYGLLPQAPYSPRSPAGMFGVTVQELMMLLNSRSI